MKTAGRYDIRGVLGEGGMGVVYRAFDPVMNREVTLKTILNPQDKAAIDLFKRECSVLSGLAHPNIVEIYDVGEVDEPGGKRPYFVMPLLRGTTLDNLIKSSSTRLNTERSVQIMAQVCRGLQAAHEQGLVHRDLKPSNIFILEDDSVKIIDFGVAHLMDQRTATGIKGTLLYMAPEQIQMKTPTPFSDQFSIGVVCYEMLAHRHPFTVPGYKDLTQAILHHTPTPICDVNQTVSRALSQVVHKVLAKEPVHRFSDVREFAECLQKALRNEPISIFDPARLEPRLDRVRKAVASGDFEFAGEIIRELESESHLHPEIQRLRQEIEQTQRRQTIAQLLETTKRRFDEEEYLLALQKVQEILDIDPTNTDAFALKGAIESKRSMAQIDISLKLAQQHLENRAYDLARKAAERVLQLRPKDTRAQALLLETERREQESSRLRHEKEKAYNAAVEFFGQGDLSAALSKLERVLELERRSPEIATPEQSASYQQLYEEVRSKRELLDVQYAEAKRFSAEGNLAAALQVCDDVLKQFPDSVVFHSLKYDIEEARREEISAFIAKVEKEVATEPDLDRKVAILEGAKQKYPAEERFNQLLARIRSRRDLVNGIKTRAINFEEAGQFAEALGQWEILRTTYAQYPGLDVEIERLKHRREQQNRDEAKSHWIAQIDEVLALNNFARADALANDALAEFKADPELLSLKKTAQLGLKRTADAQQKLDEGRQLLAAQSHEEGFASLREAAKLDPQSQTVRNCLVESLLQRGRQLLDSNWRAAEPLVAEAQDLDPGNPLAKSLRTLMRDRNESESITTALSEARELQGQGQIRNAIAVLDRAIETYPNRERLVQLRAQFLERLPQEDRAQMRTNDLRQLQQLVDDSERAADQKELESIFAKTSVFAAKYVGDSDFDEPLTVIEKRVKPPNEPATETVAIVTNGGSEIGGSSPERRKANGAPWLIRTNAGRAAIAAAVIALVLPAVLLTRKPRDNDTGLARPDKTVALTLSGITSQAQLLDSRKQNVIRQAGSLAAGTYTLVDQKPGFRVRQDIALDPSKGAKQSVVANWIPLNPRLSIHAGSAAGQWMLDGNPLKPEQLDSVEVTAGKHQLQWSDAGQILKLPFAVENGVIEVDRWMAPRGLYTMAVSLGPGIATLFPANMKVRYQAGAGPVQETDKQATIPLPASETLKVQGVGDSSAAEVGPYNPDQGGLLYVALQRPARVYRAKPQEKKNEPTVEEPAPPPTPAPPELTLEEKKAKKLRDLGLSPDVIKKKDDRK